MTALSLVTPDRLTQAAAVIVAVRPGRRRVSLVDGAQVVDGLLDGRLVELLSAARASGRAGELTRVPTGDGDLPLVIAVGLGDPATGADCPVETPEAVRRGVGAAVRSLAGTNRVAVSIGGEDETLVAAAAEGAALGSYAYLEYRTTGGTKPVGRVQIVGSVQHRAAVRRAGVLGEVVTLVRDLVNAPANDLYPETLADRAVAAATEAGATAEVLDEEQLVAGGYGGIMGVGRGSVHPPRLVKLTYQPEDAVGRIALVGKGITFDTGGYNLKLPVPVSMKHDMAGAATMLGAFLAAARLQLPVAVTALLPLAENRVSSTAYLPGDVLRIYGGTTVEVANTDAEGRLVLADALVRAAEDDPDLIVEASTLTGAQIVSLGTATAAVYGSPAGREQVVAAGRRAGEAMWPMPLLPDLRPGLDSSVADLVNVTGNRAGGSVVAALFLAEFVADGQQWAHIDMAGPAWNDGAAHDYCPKGSTGYGVRSLLTLLEDAAAT